MAALRKSAFPVEALSAGEDRADAESTFEFSTRTPDEIGVALRDYFRRAAESTDDQQGSLDELMKAIDDSRPAGQKIFNCE